MLYDTVWLDARLATLTLGQSGLGTVERGAVAAKDGRMRSFRLAGMRPAASPLTAAG